MRALQLKADVYPPGVHTQTGGYPLTSQSSTTVSRAGEGMIRGPVKILRVEAVLRTQSRRWPPGLWITIVGLEHEPFTVVALGLVVNGRPDVVWADAPRRLLHRRGWTVTKKRPLSVCFPLDSLQAPSPVPREPPPHEAIGVESVVISLANGVEMRQRIHEIVHEHRRRRWYLPFSDG